MRVLPSLGVIFAGLALDADGDLAAFQIGIGVDMEGVIPSAADLGISKTDRVLQPVDVGNSVSQRSSAMPNELQKEPQYGGKPSLMQMSSIASHIYKSAMSLDGVVVCIIVTVLVLGVALYYAIFSKRAAKEDKSADDAASEESSDARACRQTPSRSSSKGQLVPSRSSSKGKPMQGHPHTSSSGSLHATDSHVALESSKLVVLKESTSETDVVPLRPNNTPTEISDFLANVKIFCPVISKDDGEMFQLEGAMTSAAQKTSIKVTRENGDHFGTILINEGRDGSGILVQMQARTPVAFIDTQHAVGKDIAPTDRKVLLMHAGPEGMDTTRDPVARVCSSKDAQNEVIVYLDGKPGLIVHLDANGQPVRITTSEGGSVRRPRIVGLLEKCADNVRPLYVAHQMDPLLLICAVLSAIKISSVAA